MDDPRTTTHPIAPDDRPVGMLHDVYLFDTDERDWQRVLDFLHASSLALRFTVDGIETPLPDRIADVRSLQERAAVALCVDPAGMRLGCYFFTPSEIEFDVDPRDVRSPDLAGRLEAFVQAISDLLGKPAVIAEENDPANPIRRFVPRVPASPAAS